MLAGWTDWSPCSVACGGGLQQREKHVLIPTRGFGKCPKEHGPERFEEQECNTQDCVGDEICVARMDLLIAVDGSGSVRAEGFNILKSYAQALMGRYRARYFGSDAMLVGAIEFGNGIIMDDGVTVSPARNIHALSSSLEAVSAALGGMEHKKGFTNMAQAFALAESMFRSGGRKGAQPAILTITDGKPSFEFQTQELVEQLDDKGVSRFFVVLTDNDKELDLMKKWASAPWETNLLHVEGGMVSMEADEGVWVEKALTMFCPAAYSPQLATTKESSGGFMHLKDGGYCGARGSLLSTQVKDAEACAFLAQGANKQAFLLGTWFRRGFCYAGELTFDAAQYTEWEGARADPACPGEGGAWTDSMIYDFYVLEPAS